MLSSHRSHLYRMTLLSSAVSTVDYLGQFLSNRLHGHFDYPRSPFPVRRVDFSCSLFLCSRVEHHHGTSVHLSLLFHLELPYGILKRRHHACEHQSLVAFRRLSQADSRWTRSDRALVLQCSRVLVLYLCPNPVEETISHMSRLGGHGGLEIWIPPQIRHEHPRLGTIGRHSSIVNRIHFR